MEATSHEFSMYSAMLRIRKAEEKLVELWPSGEIRSLMHLSTGQEAVAVGVCSGLNQNDSVVSTHRCHAHYLAKGGSLKKMFAELAGKIGGCSRGKGGSMHLFAPEVGMNLSVPIVGGSIPIGVGIGLAAKIKNENRVSVIFFGDGALEEGVFWESLNFACVHKLPVFFVCENNLYATHAHIAKRQPDENISQRVAGFDLPTAVIDGNNVEEVFQCTQELIGFIHRSGGPVFIEAKTYRWREHWGPGEDWHLGYRSKSEGDYWKAKCPIWNFEKKLISTDDCFLDDLKHIEKLIAKEIEEALISAKISPEPSMEELYHA